MVLPSAGISTFQTAVLLVAFWLMVKSLHGEYRSSVALSGYTQFLVTAALSKIGLYVLAFAAYVLTV